MCDTMVLVADGRVLFAKNSDRDANEAQLLEWHPAARHAPGSRVRCTYIEIPQVPRTNAVLLSRPFWMWGAEMGANEHGVVIGNEAVFTNRPYAETGLLGMGLNRLALERADTAQAGVEVITDLLAAHGQGGGAGHEDRSFTYHNSFLVADPRRAFVLETAGAEWAVEEVTAGARSISNGLTIPGFAERFSERLKTRVSACAIRRARTQSLAAGAAGPAELMAVLRDHGAHGGDSGDTPRYSPLNGAMAAPCMHAGGLAAASQTTASWVAELTPAGARHWVTGTAAPCTSLFKPVAVDDPLDLGPAPDDHFDPDALWWRHEQLHRSVLRDPARLLPVYRDERDALERAWIAAPPEPAAAFAEADEALRRWTAAVAAEAGRDRRPVYARRYWRTRNRRADLPTVPVTPRDLTVR
jgi:secernin